MNCEHCNKEIETYLHGSMVFTKAVVINRETFPRYVCASCYLAVADSIAAEIPAQIAYTELWKVSEFKVDALANALRTRSGIEL